MIYSACKIVVIPHGEATVVESWGKYSRVMKAGTYLLYPWEQLKQVEWTCLEEDSKGRVYTKKFVGTMLRMTNAELDMPPFDCMTEDGIRASVNGTMLYQITDVKTAVYKVLDLLAYISQAARQAIRLVSSRHCADDMTGHDDTLSTEIVVQTNQRLVDLGVECTSFLIQNVQMDDKIMKANEDAFAKKKSYEMQIQEQEADHKCQMDQLDHQRRRGIELRRIEKATQDHELEARKRDSKSKRDIRAADWSVEQAYLKSRYEQMKTSGLDSGDIVNLEVAQEWRRGMESIGKGANSRLIYVPSDVYGMRLRSGKLLPGEDTVSWIQFCVYSMP